MEQPKSEIKIKKVLFYTHSPRAFRTTLIGYLYEISQKYPVTLLSEKLDQETEEALKDKSLFPKLKEVIPVYQFTGEKMNLFVKNRYLYRMAKNIINQHKPDVVISASDTSSLFELYLMRFAKNIKALKITIQPSNTSDIVTAEKWVDMINSYLKFSSFLPLWFRLLFVKFRKYLGHFLYYWILPLFVGEKPFFGKSSYILRRGNSGMRDTDYQIVFSKRDYDIYLKDGVSAEKLYILSHPLARETRKFFEIVYFNDLKKDKERKKIVTLMLPEITLGFRMEDYSLISKKEREEKWVEAVKLVNQCLSGWKIYIKPHPDTKNLNEIKESFESLSGNIEVVIPQEPADKYIELASVIIGLPLSASTTLFTASLRCPEKPIISLDFHREIIGDFYKDHEGIEYIDTKEKLVNLLEKIYGNKYQKKSRGSGKKLSEKEYHNFVVLLDYLFKKNKNETN